MKKIPFLFLLFIAIYGKAQQQKSPQLVKNPGTSSSELMTALIKKDAAKMPNDAPLSWVTRFNLGFPANLKIYKDLQGYGILYVAAQRPDSTEFPVRKVYIKDRSGINELREIGQMKVTVTDPQVLRVFGKNRVDYYYLIPYRATQDSCEIFLRWNKSENDVLLARFPTNLKLPFVKNLNAAGSGDIDPLALKQFMLREFHVRL